MTGRCFAVTYARKAATIGVKMGNSIYRLKTISSQ